MLLPHRRACRIILRQAAKWGRVCWGLEGATNLSNNQRPTLSTCSSTFVRPQMYRCLACATTATTYIILWFISRVLGAQLAVSPAFIPMSQNPFSIWGRLAHEQQIAGWCTYVCRMNEDLSQLVESRDRLLARMLLD